MLVLGVGVLWLSVHAAIGKLHLAGLSGRLVYKASRALVQASGDPSREFAASGPGLPRASAENRSDPVLQAESACVSAFPRPLNRGRSPPLRG